MWVGQEFDGSGLFFRQVVRRRDFYSRVVKEEAWARKDVEQVCRGLEQGRQRLLEVVHVRSLARPVVGFGVFTRMIYWVVGKEHGPVVDAIV